MRTYEQARRERAALLERIADLEKPVSPDLTASDARRTRAAVAAIVGELRADVNTLDREIAHLGELPADHAVPNTRSAENTSHGMAPYGTPGNGASFIGPEQRDGMAQWARGRYPADHDADLSFGKLLNGMVTGDWRDARDEHRAIGEGTSAGGGILVPTPLAANIIDRARNRAAVMQAGATVIPMTAQTLRVPRLVTEPDPSTKWRNEAAVISEDNLTFDSVTLTAKSLSFFVKASRELVEDATAGGGVEAVLLNSFAEVVALEIDRAALLGTGVDPQPRGLLNQSGVTLLDHTANGASVTYDFLLDAVATVRGGNFEPTAQVLAPRSEQSLSKIKDTTGAYLAPPAALSGIPRLMTKQVPINITTGTSTDTSYVFTGEWSNLWIGVRTSMQIDVLRERFMTDSGQYGFVCWLRADVAVAQPTAFAIDRGVRP